MLDSFLAFVLTHEIRGIAMLLVAISLCLIVVPLLCSYLLVSGTILLSRHFDIVARPSHRGSHLIPTPRLGGLGGAAAFYIAVILLARWRMRLPTEPWVLTLLTGGIWALIGGALDDCQELSGKWKLLLQVAASGAVVAFGFAPVHFQLPLVGTIVFSHAIGMIVAFFITFFLMNIFNFMDGMDGHAAGFGIVTAFSLGLFLANYGFQTNGGTDIRWYHKSESAAAIVIGATLIGLLCNNHPWRRQDIKTFMGDCGSQFYGFVLAVIALQAGESRSVDTGQFPWMASLILFSPFIYDVVFTLIRRYRNGDKLNEAHRTHLYQRLMVAGWSHGKTLGFNLCLWLGMAALSWFYAVGADYGLVVVQFFSLFAAVALLTGYTFAVMDVEQVMKRKKADESRRESVLAAEAHYPGAAAEP